MKILKRISITIIGMLILFNSCKTKDLSYNVININDARGIRNNAVIYFLPKTVVRTEFKLKKTTYKKGPFAEYSKRYLGIENAIQSDAEQWEIVDIGFSTYPLVDSSQIYLIEHDEVLESIDVQLNSLGVLKSFNSSKIVNSDILFNRVTDKNNIKANTLFENETNQILPKSKEINFDDVPLPKKIVSGKNISEKAKELANKILTLREDMSATLVGDGYTEIVPDGKALLIMVNNLNKLENQYLSLFKGKMKEETFNYSFDFIPTDARDVTQKILFRFSYDKGIVANNDMSGLPVILELDAFRNLSEIISFDKKQEHLKRVAKIKERKRGLFYRIPDMVKAKLLIKDNSLAEKNILISQFGVIQNLLSEYLNGDYSIEMNSKLGSIKRIDKLVK